LLYLRARHYSPADGRFTSRDTWSGDYNRPLSLNRWNYGYSSPTNFTDASGQRPLRPCIESRDQECLATIDKLKIQAEQIKRDVASGQLMPVEGFAMFTDLALSKLDYDIRDAVWATTLIINGFDANSAWPIWLQAFVGGTNYSSSFIGQNWLPYKDASCADIGWWVCSERGDWKVEYWDKTANQAYHGWFFAAAMFFHGNLVANFANNYHEGRPPFDEIPPDGPPPQHGKTQQDYLLSLKMMELGRLLHIRYIDQSFNELTGICPPTNSNLPLRFRYSSIGSWIRSNLKDYSAYNGGKR
jgi:hypothetical protein